MFHKPEVWREREVFQNNFGPDAERDEEPREHFLFSKELASPLHLHESGEGTGSRSKTLERQRGNVPFLDQRPAIPHWGTFIAQF